MATPCIPFNIRPLDCATDSVTICNLDPINVTVELDCATDSVTICPPVSGVFQVALDAPSLIALETVTVLQGTNPWVVSTNGAPAADAESLWAVSNAPAEGSAASATRATPGVGKQLVVTSIEVSIAAGLLIITGSPITAVVTTSGGSVLWRGVLGVTNVVGSATQITNSVTLPVPTNEAVTLAFTGGVASTIQAVAMSGYVSSI